MNKASGPENRASGRPPSTHRTYLGGCDCGSVRFAVELELRERDTRTQSVWEHSVPPTRFRLHMGHDCLVGYQFAAENAHHFFCTRCQSRVFSHYAPELSVGYYSVDLKTLYARELYTPSQTLRAHGS